MHSSVELLPCKPQEIYISSYSLYPKFGTGGVSKGEIDFLCNNRNMVWHPFLDFPALNMIGILLQEGLIWDSSQLQFSQNL